MSQATTDSLIAEYRYAAAQHGAAKTSRAANAAATRLATVYSELRIRDARQSLLPLLEDTNPSVRCWAAAHALEFAPEKAEEVLKTMADGAPGPLRADAVMTLREWRAGRLRFP